MYTAISAGGWHACGLTSTDGVKCWGWGENGAIGDGTTEDRTIPVGVSGLSSGVIKYRQGLIIPVRLLRMVKLNAGEQMNLVSWELEQAVITKPHRTW